MSAVALARPMAADVWVTCSRYSDVATSSARHIVRRGWRGREWVVTACGADGPSTAWWADARKPMCARCVERFNAESQDPTRA